MKAGRFCRSKQFSEKMSKQKDKNNLPHVELTLFNKAPLQLSKEGAGNEKEEDFPDCKERLPALQMSTFCKTLAMFRLLVLEKEENMSRCVFPEIW